jgi:CubicO group peptidase (beta-lactamase class C family)
MIEDRTRRLLDVRLARDQAGQRLPSVAAGLVRDGEIVWAGGRGLVDGQPPDVTTQYRAGSITKTFVASCVLRLRDADKLSLSDPLGAHLDAATAGAAAAMTIGQLLSHSAGLRAETAGPWWERTPGVSLAELSAGSLGEEAARFRPGRRHHYSNVGYALLGALLETAHGKPWSDVVAAELLDPLGMTRTTTRPRRPYAPGYAVHPFADALLAEPEHDAGAMAPAGQLWTTVADLAAFVRFLSGDAGLLAPQTLAEMREPVVISDLSGQPWAAGYGLGLQLWNSGGQRYYGHTGSMPGFIALLQITDAPGADAAIVLCNSTSGFSRDLGSDLLTILAECEPYCPPEWIPARVSEQLLDMLGPWYWGPVPFSLRLDGQTLELRREDDGDSRSLRFRPDGEGGWTGVDGYQAGEPLVPLIGRDGSVHALDIGSFIYTRTPYDPAAPVPGGVDASGWQAAPARHALSS